MFTSFTKGSIYGAVLTAIAAIVICVGICKADDGANIHLPDGVFFPKPIYTAGYAPVSDGPGIDKQFRSQFGMGLKLYDLWDTVHIHTAMNARLVGNVDEVSAPFTNSFLPEVYARYALNGTTSVDYGWIHESNGEALDSRSWDRQFARLNVVTKYGDFVFDVHAMLFEAFIVAPENMELIDVGEGSDGLRTFSGRYGIEGHGTISFRDDAILWLDVAENKLEASLAINTSSDGTKRWYTMLLGWTGTGDVIVNHDAFTKGVGVGLMYAH